MKTLAPDFEPKADYTTRGAVKFDENIRHRMDTVPNSLIYRAIDNALPPMDEPQSMYVSV
jgi:large subunit ribosomal protein L13